MIPGLDDPDKDTSFSEPIDRTISPTRIFRHGSQDSWSCHRSSRQASRRDMQRKRDTIRTCQRCRVQRGAQDACFQRVPAIWPSPVHRKTHLYILIAFVDMRVPIRTMTVSSCTRPAQSADTSSRSMRDRARPA